MQSVRLALAGMLLTIFPCVADAQNTAHPITRSATQARDIGGFVLGMNIRDAGKLAPLKNIGNGGFQTTKDGIRYDFDVTRLGRIYRIDSEQDLGRFIVDNAFLRSLTSKLTIKYGPPESHSTETWDWSLVELVTPTGGQVLPFTTNWAAAYVDSGEEGVTLHIKLLDFRVMWQDEANLNRAPRDQAAGKVAL